MFARTIVASLLLSSTSLIAADPITIMPLGDSITAGGGGGGGYYRHFLAEELSKGDIDFRFVGPKTDAKGFRHAGYPGWNSTKIRRIISEIYERDPADAVLLHMGHNHFVANKPVQLIVQNTEGVIDAILSINPKASIYLAQVITAGKLPKYSYIPELNRQLDVLAKSMQAAGKPVVLVDQAAGFDWKTDTVADKVHPNEAGSKKLAQRWAKAIMQQLPAK